jgi:hypothetical protein
MPGWRTWAKEIGIGVAAAAYCWQFFAKQQPPSDRLLCLAILLALFITARALSYLPVSRSLPAQITVAVLFLLSFWRFRTPFRGIVEYLCVTGVLLFFFQFLPRRNPPRIGEWWPAVKRTTRRLRGNWREDDERFARQMAAPSKKP